MIVVQCIQMLNHDAVQYNIVYRLHHNKKQTKKSRAATFHPSNWQKLGRCITPKTGDDVDEFLYTGYRNVNSTITLKSNLAIFSKIQHACRYIAQGNIHINLQICLF